MQSKMALCTINLLKHENSSAIPHFRKKKWKEGNINQILVSRPEIYLIDNLVKQSLSKFLLHWDNS